LVALFYCCLVGETITGRIEDPWVVVRALHTGVKAEDLSWQFSVGLGKKSINIDELKHFQ
jgi:hypothetical protein